MQDVQFCGRKNEMKEKMSETGNQLRCPFIYVVNKKENETMEIWPNASSIKVVNNI